MSQRAVSRSAWRRAARGAALLAVAVAIAAGVAYLARYELARWRLELPAFTHSPARDRLEWVEMRDGVRLATRVYPPAGEGPWPAVVIRNPYDARGFIEGWCGLFVRYGYTCVYQHARGQMQSEGEWDPFMREQDDGTDTLAWLVAQPWQDGNVALYGPSYLGAVQWAAAGALPPEVKTMVPIMFGTDLYRFLWQRGMQRKEILTAWTMLMPRRGMHMENGALYQRALAHRPFQEIDESLLGERLDWFREWSVSVDPDAALWQLPQVRELLAQPERLRVPILSIAGWYDIFLASQLDDFARLPERGRSKLVIGPWTHLMVADGDLELPDARGPGWQWRLVLDWFGHHLKGEPLEQRAGVVESYVIGEGRWETRPEWPPPVRAQRLYFELDPDAGSGCDAHGLRADSPSAGARVDYRYDPADPVPSLGGAHGFAHLLPGFGGGSAASVLQADACERADVTSFASAALAAPLHLAGAFRIVLRVSSDAPDTAFTAKLVEVKPDGRAFHIRDAIASLRFRDGARRPLAYAPGSEVSVEIESWPIEWVLQAGSRLRVDVSSSNYPAFHAHPNVAEPDALVREPRVALQSLYTGGAAEAFVELPVLGASAAH